ncbi:MAG: DUF1330 domain-containing protein [Burkholderiales bacterium]|nr:MAG: DUF1330 domain-containing protein [Betaproteobacteria bacterium]TAG80463.1 MAG: DUF1330 domain-containing protein [Burkholderiales bacterium]
MPAFVIASVNVTNPEKYKDYMALSPGAIAAHGGKFVVRGGNPEILEGEWPRQRVVVVEFPSREAAKKFYDSVEYTKARKEREGAAEFSMIVVDGL